jgi:hypothetical protein
MLLSPDHDVWINGDLNWSEDDCLTFSQTNLKDKIKERSLASAEIVTEYNMIDS